MPDQSSARERLEHAMKGVQALQTLADEYGIDDIFQDNGGKVLQTLIILDFKQLAGREGNDAKDSSGQEFELKTVNVRKQKQVTSHHHLNNEILDKYRKVAAWIISLYEGINLREIYRVETCALEELFSDWERRIATSKAGSLNNPKIPLTLVAEAVKNGTATRVYPTLNPSEGASFLDTVVGQRRKRLARKIQHTLF